jgi:hypothetical protein
MSIREAVSALEALGMPREHLEPLRHLANEDQLLDSLTNIPAEWANTALDLVELAGLRIPKAKFHIFEADSAFEDLLNRPFEEWQIYLHPAQKHIVELPWDFRTIVSGSAGTGKTVCAWHRIEMLCSEGHSVGFACPNDLTLRLSKAMLSKLLKECHTDCLCLVPRNEQELVDLAQEVDHLVVDEGQELSPAWYAALANGIRGKKSGLTIFCDLNQIFGGYEPGDTRRYTYRAAQWDKAMAQQLHCVRINLSVNYRNSREISTYYFDMLDEALLKPIKSEVPLFSAGEVIRHKVQDRREMGLAVAEIVRRLCRDYSERDIGIVSLLNQQATNELADALGRLNIALGRDPLSCRGVLLARPKEIRGYERRAIIVAAPKRDFLIRKVGRAIDAYVGLSRARDSLAVVELEAEA